LPYPSLCTSPWATPGPGFPSAGQRPWSVTRPDPDQFDGQHGGAGAAIVGVIGELFPKLKIVTVEGNIGWIPYFLERADRIYQRHRFWSRLELPMQPSEYFHCQVYATFIEDKAGIRLRDLIGVDNLMWSSDYPHTDTTWPNSRKYIEDTMAGVPEEEKRKVISGNAARLYASD
jgi:predicted TIM-barrel fold metal-dependent hydrolase